MSIYLLILKMDKKSTPYSQKKKNNINWYKFSYIYFTIYSKTISTSDGQGQQYQQIKLCKSTL